jgi:hypothetical protein
MWGAWSTCTGLLSGPDVVCGIINNTTVNVNESCIVGEHHCEEITYHTCVEKGGRTYYENMTIPIGFICNNDNIEPMPPSDATMQTDWATFNSKFLGSEGSVKNLGPVSTVEDRVTFLLGTKKLYLDDPAAEILAERTIVDVKKEFDTFFTKLDDSDWVEKYFKTFNEQKLVLISETKSFDGYVLPMTFLARINKDYTGKTTIEVKSVEINAMSDYTAIEYTPQQVSNFIDSVSNSKTFSVTTTKQGATRVEPNVYFDYNSLTSASYSLRYSDSKTVADFETTAYTTYSNTLSRYGIYLNDRNFRTKQVGTIEYVEESGFKGYDLQYNNVENTIAVGSSKSYSKNSLTIIRTPAPNEGINKGTIVVGIIAAMDLAVLVADFVSLTWALGEKSEVTKELCGVSYSEFEDRFENASELIYNSTAHCKDKWDNDDFSDDSCSDTNLVPFLEVFFRYYKVCTSTFGQSSLPRKGYAQKLLDLYVSIPLSNVHQQDIFADLLTLKTINKKIIPTQSDDSYELEFNPPTDWTVGITSDNPSIEFDDITYISLGPCFAQQKMQRSEIQKLEGKSTVARIKYCWVYNNNFGEIDKHKVIISNPRNDEFSVNISLWLNKGMNTINCVNLETTPWCVTDSLSVSKDFGWCLKTTDLFSCTSKQPRIAPWGCDSASSCLTGVEASSIPSDSLVVTLTPQKTLLNCPTADISWERSGPSDCSSGWFACQQKDLTYEAGKFKCKVSVDNTLKSLNEFLSRWFR